MVAPASRHGGGFMPSLIPPAGGDAAGRSGEVLRFPLERRLAGRHVSTAHPVFSGARARPAGQAGAPPAVRPPAPLRLTRRGRAVLWALAGLLLLALVIAGVLIGSRTASAGRDAQPLPVTYRVVQSGETLWGIAGEVAPNADRRDVVADLVDLNALPSASVSAGQRIAIPSGQGW